MFCSRRIRLSSASVLLLSLLTVVPLWSQSQAQSSSPASQSAEPQPGPAAQQPSPQPPQPQAPPAQQPREQQPKQPATQQPKTNPFENVPQAEPPQQQKPAPEQAKPQLEAPKTPETAPQAAENVIESIEFRGARRVPQDTLRALIITKKGDIYNEDAMHGDFMRLWNTGRFDDIRLETEQGKTGIIVRYVLTERRVVRSIKYSPGMKSVSVSEVLDRFQERKVGLTVESQYDPNKVQRAAVVLKEYLAERGRQFATVEPEIRQVPPSSLEITFNVNEGPKVKVGTIDIQGNQVFSDRVVIRAMKNLHPIGIPHSIFFESIFAKTYDSSKLEEDKERVRQFYQDKGYFMARVLDQKVTLRDVGGKGLRIPLFKPNKPGKRADIAVPVEEGRLFHLSKMNFVGVKLFKTTDFLQKQIFQMQEGDVFSTAKLRKGIDQLKKLYGEFGYIDFVPEPSFDPNPNSDKIDLTLTADEGKQFFVRRIDFSGNTTTRDKVIRRELLLDEGDIFNSRLWELSVLRLNQLGYFETLKAEEAATIQRNTQSNTVDLTLKVKERGKNSIGLNGGVSGIAGSFVGFNYSTNNFLGLGETLSIESQLGTRMRDVSFGFTEPYFLDKPIQMGFVVYLRRFNFDQGREISILTGRDLIPLFNQLGKDNLLNYIQNGHGFSFSTSKMLRRSFARVGLTYGFDNSSIVVNSNASRQYFEFINFQGINGPNSLNGIKTSSITPSYTYNTVNHPLTPTGGRSLFISTQFSGSFLGGNVNTIRPTVDVKYFRPSPIHRSHILAFHAMGSLLTGYGGKVAPPFARTYIGGEQDIRGFDIWGVSPIAFVPSEATVSVYNNDGTPRQQTVLVNGAPAKVADTIKIPVYQLIFPGGDTQVVTNFEYRITIFGPVTLAVFFDAGVNRILRSSQLTMNPGRIAELNGTYPQAGFDGKVKIAGGTQKMRASTGLELQVLLPIVQAPFRIYWAYNPLLVREYLQPPIVADRSFFPNNTTFLNSVALWGRAFPFFEKRSTFRFTIGRTF
ncbi:MAG: outer membrane protein assembly factor BamA [Acidobacteria bacterium]|nr:MAG: outer membrane protein assembly factor BamA [Acidobacteriota bacterium]